MNRPSSRTQVVLLACALLFIVFTILGFRSTSTKQVFSSYHPTTTSSPGTGDSVAPSHSTNVSSDLPAQGDELKHLLLPASNPDVNLCKTLLTAAVLGYPTPRLIAWNETFDQGYLLGGGSHVAKISKTLEYLESLPASADDELVMMADAYGPFLFFHGGADINTHAQTDIWFQLRPEVMVSRYHAINAQANRRLRKRLGSAVDIEGLEQTIIFAAGKRCAPNQVHTVACYPIPDSPLPDDLYGPNTDTIMGRNKYTSLKQRYLNSGYILGPVGDMRKMFERAWIKAQAVKDHIDWDNGSGGSDFMYHGSDQSIFNIMLGEQEFQREVMRRRHRSTKDKIQGIGGDPKPWRIEGTLVDDPLNPSFLHEPMEHKAGKPDEFSMGLDYFSDLGLQTVNAEEDGKWIDYTQDISKQVEGRHLFDCPSRVTGAIAQDIADSRPPYAAQAEHGEQSLPQQWKQVPLYTNLCINTIPVMVHHNGDKSAREHAWEKLWLQPQARKLMGDLLEVDGMAGGAMAGERELSWESLCPVDMERELYRDVE